jgi:hypothetical protein
VDAAWIGALAGVIGAGAGAAATVLGPLRLQKRQARAQQEVVQREAVKAGLAAISEATTAARRLLDALARVVGDARRPNALLPLADFDARIDPLWHDVEDKLAALLVHGIDQFQGQLERRLRTIHQDVREAVAASDRDRLEALARNEHYWGQAISARRSLRTDWINRLMSRVVDPDG